jgi:hypothetical protein
METLEQINAAGMKILTIIVVSASAFLLLWGVACLIAKKRREAADALEADRAKNPCKYNGHDKRWVAIRTAKCVRGDRTYATDAERLASQWPENHREQQHDHPLASTVYIARWACRTCPKMGEDCIGHEQDWKIEHEQLVPDTKKWANWSQGT